MFNSFTPRVTLFADFNEAKFNVIVASWLIEEGTLTDFTEAAFVESITTSFSPEERSTFPDRSADAGAIFIFTVNKNVFSAVFPFLNKVAVNVASLSEVVNLVTLPNPFKVSIVELSLDDQVIFIKGEVRLRGR